MDLVSDLASSYWPSQSLHRSLLTELVPGNSPRDGRKRSTQVVPERTRQAHRSQQMNFRWKEFVNSIEDGYHTTPIVA